MSDIDQYAMLVEQIPDGKTQYVVFEVWSDGARCVHNIIALPNTWSDRRKRDNVKRNLPCVSDFNAVWKSRTIIPAN